MRLISKASNQRAFLSIRGADNAFKSGISSALADIGQRNVNEATRLILSPPKTGRIYIKRIGGRIIRHQASAPGQAPANMSGFLAKQNAYVVTGYRFMKFGNRVFYAKFLELGTRKMAARPFLSKTVDKNSGYAYSALAAAPKGLFK